MKKTIRSAIMIIVLCLALCAAAFAAGSNYTKQLLANYIGVQLVVDGVTITPKDASGNVVEPFIVDGTTYLPVRAVAEALGKDVSWDGTTKTVYIGKKPADSQETASDYDPDIKKWAHYLAVGDRIFQYKNGGGDYTCINGELYTQSVEDIVEIALCQGKFSKSENPYLTGIFWGNDWNPLVKVDFDTEYISASESSTVLSYNYNGKSFSTPRDATYGFSESNGVRIFGVTPPQNVVPSASAYYWFNVNDIMKLYGLAGNFSYSPFDNNLNLDKVLRFVDTNNLYDSLKIE